MAAATPQIVSVSPSSGSGDGGIFTLTVSDSAGASDIAGMNLLFNGALNGAKACWIYYDRVQRAAYLADDEGTKWNPIGAGTPVSAQNNQCTVTFVAASDSGNQASVSLDVRFGTGWQSIYAAPAIWARAGDISGADSGYRELGRYSIQSQGATPDYTVSVTNPTQTVSPGGSAAFHFTVTSVNGLTGTLPNSISYAGLYTAPQGVSAVQDPAVLTLPPNGTVSGTVTVSTTADTALVTLDVSDWFYFGRNHGFNVSVLVTPPTAAGASVSPSSGNGSARTFTVTATHPGGFQEIGGIHFLMNSSIDGKNACWFYYQVDSQKTDASGTLFLASDDTNIWTSTSVSSDPAIAKPLHNSQCTLFGGPGPITATGSGNTLTLTLPLEFSALFGGVRNIYSSASSKSGADTGYRQTGTWEVVGSGAVPDFRVDIVPGPQTVAGQGTVTYGLGLTPVNGFTGTVDFNISGLPANSTLTPPGTMTPGGTPTHFSVNTSGNTPAGTYTLTVTGTSGNLSRTAQVLLTVQAAGGSMPLAILNYPLQGSGSTQTFYATAWDALGAANITGLNVLINSSVDGRNACWMYYDGSQLWLASDDALVWTHTDAATPTIHNSQCTVSSVTRVDPQTSGGLPGFSADISFSTSFAGAKNTFVRTANKQGQDTGYQLQGTWTVP